MSGIPISGVPITIDVLLPLLPSSLQPLVREAWDDVQRGVALVQRGEVLVLASDGETRQVRVEGREALRARLLGWNSADALKSVLMALASECAPGLVRVIVLGPGASMALRLPR